MGTAATVGKAMAGGLGKVVGAAVEEMGFNPGPFAQVTGRELGLAKSDIGDIWNRVARSARGLLDSYGPRVRQLREAMDETSAAGALRAGQDDMKVSKILRGMNAAEREHVWDVMEGLQEARHQKYWDAGQQIREIYDSYAVDAIDLGIDVYAGSEYRNALKNAMDGKIMGVTAGDYQAATRWAMEKARRPFMERPNYLPHYFDAGEVARLMANGPRKEAILNELKNRGWAEDRVSAEVLMRELLERPAEFRGGPLQHMREDLFNEGYVKDLEKVSKRYFTTAAHRLEQARRFGSRDEEAMKAINALGDNVTDETGQVVERGIDSDQMKVVANVYSAWAGTKDPKYSNLARTLGTVHSVTLLSTAGFVQPAQISNIVARTGWVNTIKAMGGIFKDWVRGENGHEAFAQSSGALLDSIRAEYNFSSLQDIGQVWMKVIGMEQLDRLNRVIAANSGRLYADALAKGMMKKGANAEEFRRLFGRLGVDADEVFKRGGKLTLDESRAAGLAVSRDTQFASSVLDLPYMRNTPQGKFGYLFKSFALQQAYFLKRELLDEAYKHGNYKPLIQYGSALVIASPVMGEMMRQIKGRKPPDEGWQRDLENLAYVGAFGAFYDTARAFTRGPDALYAYVLGPTASEAATFLASDLPSIYKRGDVKPLVRHIIRRTPLIGQYIHNAWSESW